MIFDRWRFIKWKITNSSGSTLVRFWFVASYAVNPAKIRTNVFCSETTVHWPHCSSWQLRPMFVQLRMVSSESHNICTLSVSSRTRTFRQTDRRTDRQTEFIIADAALCIARYADGLQKLRFSTTPLSFDLMPPPEEPRPISAYTYIPRIIDLHFALIVWVYLYSHFLVGSVKQFFLRKSAFWPFTVIQGHWFWY